MASTSKVSAPEKASNHDELFMQQSLLFADTLQDLKNLRKQLYSAAEFFEISYGKEAQKQIVVETLKDYAIKALINTVDHLGSVAFKVDSLFDEKIGEVSETELRFTCLEQRVKSCQEFVNQGGLSQQSLVIITPKHHKCYIFPDEDAVDGFSQAPLDYQDSGLGTEEESNRFKSCYFLSSINNFCSEPTYAAKARTIESPSSYVRKVHSTLQSPIPSSRQGTFSFTRSFQSKKQERRAGSPHHFPQVRSGSLLKRSPSPSDFNAKRRYPSELRRSVSLSTFAERNRKKDFEQNSGKSKRLFKALLSLRKSRKDGTLYKFLDEN